jgi:hypothetical protein
MRVFRLERRPGREVRLKQEEQVNMSNGNILRRDYGRDDGFSAASSADRTIKGTQLVWNDAQHWRDRDGLKPPAQLLVVGTDAILQRWKDGKPEVIRDRPLPDPDDLNAAIPVDQWETGIDGQKRPPWADTVVVYAIDPATGAFFTYVSSTTGGRIAVDHLQESVEGMRMLRGDRVLPLITLGERPMKTKFGVKSRPHFEIAGWKETTGPALEEEPPRAALPPASEPEPEPVKAAAPALQSEPARAKRKTTLEPMGDVKPVSPGEAINDKIPW